MLNLYGDKVKDMAAGHGVDVATQRADDLDMRAVEFCQTKKKPLVLDLACGAGGQSARMAAVGAHVVGVDIIDMAAAFSETMAHFERLSTEWGGTEFHQLDMTAFPSWFLQKYEGKFDAIVCQRAIHYLPHAQARILLAILKVLLKDDGQLFISCSGLHSELGQGYAANALGQRFDKLSPQNQDKHAIHHPVCLYSKDEFGQTLELVGWRIVSLFTSPFGNIKAITSKV